MSKVSNKMGTSVLSVFFIVKKILALEKSGLKHVEGKPAHCVAGAWRKGVFQNRLSFLVSEQKPKNLFSIFMSVLTY